jgi:transcriptional regulator with XRE-family HTH domain
MGTNPRTRRTVSEDYIAERIGLERRKRGLSYRQLAIALAQLPEDTRVKIDQSAIQRIEKGPQGVRRRITVDEAVSFAAVFGVPITDWLLIPTTQTDVEGWQAYQDAVAALAAVRDGVSKYVDAVETARARMSPQLRERVEADRDEALARLQEEITDERQPSGGWDLSEDSTPAAVAARDVLSDDPLTNETRWWKATRDTEGGDHD